MKRWEPNKIKGMLTVNGVKLKDIASEGNVTRSAITKIINGESTSSKLQRIIAEKLRAKQQEVFGR